MSAHPSLGDARSEVAAPRADRPTRHPRSISDNSPAAVPGIVRRTANAGRHVHLVDMCSALTTAGLADGVHPHAGGGSGMAALRSVPGSQGGGTAEDVSRP